jgi:thioredoxin
MHLLVLGEFVSCLLNLVLESKNICVIDVTFAMENLEVDQIDTVLSKTNQVLIMFYADWCPFCQKFKPMFESLPCLIDSRSNAKYRAYGAKLNDDDNPLWDRFSISSVPTLIAFDKARPVARRDARMGVGLTKSDLDSILSELKWN